MHRLRRSLPLLILIFLWSGPDRATAESATESATAESATAESATAESATESAGDLSIKPTASATSANSPTDTGSTRSGKTTAAAESEHATELHIRPIISPVNVELRTDHIFQIKPATSSADVSGGALRTALDDHKASRVFSDTPAVIPVWQLRSLVQNNTTTSATTTASTASNAASKTSAASTARTATIVRTTPKTTTTLTAIVGKPAIYLPEDLDTPGERTFFIRALDELEKFADDDDMRIEIEIPRFPEDMEGFEVISVIPMPTGSGLFAGTGSLTGDKKRWNLFFKKGGNVRFLCRAEKDGRVVEKVVTGEVYLFLPQPTAPMQIRKGEILELSGVDLQAIPVGEVPENYRIGTEGRYTAKTDIDPGEILSLRNLRLKPDVEIGDSVRVTLRYGSVTLRIPGTARGNGSYGDTVAVRLDSGVVRDCRIRNNGEVSIE